MTLGPRLTVLVPARNAEHLLGDWLTSVAAYADAVVALDDGSTDGTRSILERHPLVREVLTNPIRSGYQGWDDLENRQRLVDAARDANDQWLLFLDADERIDADDGRALRAFLEAEALPGFAYGFEVFRMEADTATYDPHGMWVFRMFSTLDAAAPLGSQRLHFVPVPSGVPMHRWLHTSVRIQHLGSLTAEHRQARFDKYLEADPDNAYQPDYINLLVDPETVEPWPTRRGDVPVLLGPEGRYADRFERFTDASPLPTLSAVVIAQDDRNVIDRSLRALVDQQVDEEFEIILVCSGRDDTARHAAATYPMVRCLQLPERALPGEARNAGLWMARGEYVTFPGSHVWLLPGSLQARIDAHEDGWDLVTGSVVNGNETRAGWASYFLDHSTQLPSRPPGPLDGVAGHASYATRDVRAVGGFPEDMRAGEDTVVNRQLYFAGKQTYFCAEVSFAHASPSTTTRPLLRHHFQRGRALGRIIQASARTRSERVRLASTMSLPVRRLRTIRRALTDADETTRRQHRSVRGLVAAGAIAASMGTWTELLSPSTVATERAPQPARSTDGPILALGGRPGEAAIGLLAVGTPADAAQHLRTLVRYGETVRPVRAALAPIVTSATLTIEHRGTHTLDLDAPIVQSYLTAARAVGARLLLQVQPGTAVLATLVERWRDLIEEPDVDIMFDLRPQVAFRDQSRELADAVTAIHRLAADTLVLAYGTRATDPAVIAVDDVQDLRRPGTLYPHDALRADPCRAVFLYQ